jgi:hypothetical protein
MSTTVETAKHANGRAKPTTCVACKGKNGAHTEGCVNQVCAECGSFAGGHHAGCRSRPGDVAFDGTTGAPIATNPDAGDDEDDEEEESDDSDVDDELNAQLEAMDARHPKSDIERAAPPSLNAMQAARLQEALMDRVVVGLKQPMRRSIYCDAYQVEGDKKIGCGGLAAFAVVDEAKCGDCGKVRSKRKAALCVPHAGRFVSGESIDPQMSLLGAA